MTMRRRAVAFVLVFAAGLTVTEDGRALEVRCERGALVRNIEVQLAGDADGLPCRVTWQSAAGADRTPLVWRSAARLDFCTDKERELVRRLTDRGWACAAETAPARDPSAGPPAVRPGPAAPQPDAALRLSPAPAAGDPPARHGEEAAPPPDRTALEAALARDVARLGELVGSSPASFQVSTARLGDLDGDGIEDAVALLTHRAKDGPPSHHLLAYEFDGETFQPAARLVLTEAAEAQLQDIADGVIEVIVSAPQAGDPACCPSGHRRVSFALRNQALVKIGEDRPDA